MNVICDEEGLWCVEDDNGKVLAGPFKTQEEAWEAMDEIDDPVEEYADGRDFTPPYEP